MTQQLYIKTDGPIPEGSSFEVGKLYKVYSHDGYGVDFAHPDSDVRQYSRLGGTSAHLDDMAGFTLCDSTGNPVPAPSDESTPAKSVQCQCFNEPDWPSPEFAKQQPICDEFTAMARDPYICERCEHNEACHVPQVNYRAHAEALAEALRDARSGMRYIREQHGDLYGVGFDRVEQSSTEALAAFDQDRGVKRG